MKKITILKQLLVLLVLFCASACPGNSKLGGEGGGGGGLDENRTEKTEVTIILHNGFKTRINDAEVAQIRTALGMSSALSTKASFKVEYIEIPPADTVSKSVEKQAENARNEIKQKLKPATGERKKVVFWGFSMGGTVAGVNMSEAHINKLKSVGIDVLGAVLFAAPVNPTGVPAVVNMAKEDVKKELKEARNQPDFPTFLNILLDADVSCAGLQSLKPGSKTLENVKKTLEDTSKFICFVAAGKKDSLQGLVGTHFNLLNDKILGGSSDFLVPPDAQYTREFIHLGNKEILKFKNHVHFSCGRGRPVIFTDPEVYMNVVPEVIKMIEGAL